MTNDGYNDDDLDGIFENLTPEDFLAQESSAVGIEALASHDREFTGIDAYGRFVARAIGNVRTSFAQAEGEINPVAIMATRDKQYVYVPDEDEEIGHWTDRLRREATKLGVHWVFICRKTMVGSAAEDGNAPVGDEDVFERAAASGRMRPGVLFYTQRREAGDLESHYGYLHATDTVTLGDVVMGHGGQQVPMFDVLG